MKRTELITIKCIVALIIVIQLSSCTKPQIVTDERQLENQLVVIEESGDTISTRILPPIDFERIPVQKGSYADYLRTLPLKPHASPVLYYDGSNKDKDNVYIAVVDMSIGDRDLQQCADAIMRLRGEFLYGIGEYDQIHFNFTNGFRVDYSKWIEGYRVVVEGNQSNWRKKTQPSNTYQDFINYMDTIFTYAGTLSLENELTSVNLDEMKIGDIFIQGGSPGHAVVVVDMAVNETSQEKIYLLAQSYMPAQDTQILVNPNDHNLTPWYSLSFEGDDIVTPEWTFNSKDLKKFPEQ